MTYSTIKVVNLGTMLGNLQHYGKFFGGNIAKSLEEKLTRDEKSLDSPRSPDDVIC